MSDFTAVESEAARHERAGRWDEAFTQHNEAFRLAVREADTALMVRALLGTARNLHQSGRFDAAEEVADMSLIIARCVAATREIARATNMLGVIRHLQEDWHGAQGFYREALESARDEGDDELIAAICQNLGVVANALGDLREARVLYLEGISASVRAGKALMTGLTYNNLGMVCSDLEEWTEAEVHFLRGVEIAEHVDDVLLLARLSTGRAEPLIRTGEFAAARASLDRAEELAQRLDDDCALSDIYRHRGTMARLENSLEAAEAHLERSLSIAKGANLDLEEAETLEQMALLRQAQGRQGAARMMLREARRIYGSLGAQRDLARLDALGESWSALPKPQGGG